MKKIIFMIMILSINMPIYAASSGFCQFNGSNMVIIVDGVNRYIWKGEISHNTKGFKIGKLVIRDTEVSGNYRWVDHINTMYKPNITIPVSSYGKVDLHEICQ